MGRGGKKKSAVVWEVSATTASLTPSGAGVREGERRGLRALGAKLQTQGSWYNLLLFLTQAIYNSYEGGNGKCNIDCMPSRLCSPDFWTSHVSHMLDVMICFSLFFILFCFSPPPQILFFGALLIISTLEDWEGKVMFLWVEEMIESHINTIMQYGIGVMWQVLIYPVAIYIPSLFMRVLTELLSNDVYETLSDCCTMELRQLISELL